MLWLRKFHSRWLPQSIPPLHLPFAALVTAVQCAEHGRAHTSSSAHEPESRNRPCASKPGRSHNAGVRALLLGVSVPALVTSAQCAVDGRPRTVASVHETESRHRPFLSTPTHAQARTHGPGPVDMWASINSPMIAQSRSSRPNFVTAVLGNCLTAIKG